MTIVLDCPSKGIGRFACAQAGCSICMESLLREHRGLIWRMVTRAGRGKADCEACRSIRGGTDRVVASDPAL